jgi:hypothetical protein
MIYGKQLTQCLKTKAQLPLEGTRHSSVLLQKDWIRRGLRNTATKLLQDEILEKTVYCMKDVHLLA